MVRAAQSVQHYDGRTVVFHWVTVLLVLGQWFGAHAIDWFSRGWPRTDARSVHILAGVLLGVLIAYRLLWRWRGGRRLPHAEVWLFRLAANLMHGALYGLLLAVILLGLVNAWFHGDSMFGLYTLPKPGFVTLYSARRIAGLHELAANLILLLAALHACAALWRQYGRHDGTLSRMATFLDARH